MQIKETVMDPVALQAQLSRDGYLVFPEVVSAETCARLRERAHTLADAAASEGPVSYFTTDESRRQIDDYFLTSGRKIRVFFEDIESPTEAVDQRVNKLGHALHDLDPLFDAFSRHRFFSRLAHCLGFKSPKLVQSMYIFKAPYCGGQVDWHQDSTFLWTQPLSVVGFWVALEDAHMGNGCLQVVPGGHRQGLKRRFVRRDDDTTAFIELQDDALDTDGAIPLEVPQGSVVVLHGSLPHTSAANDSADSRPAYTLHIVEGLAHYDQANWLRCEPDTPWRGFD